MILGDQPVAKIELLKRRPVAHVFDAGVQSRRNYQVLVQRRLLGRWQMYKSANLPVVGSVRGLRPKDDLIVRIGAKPTDLHCNGDVRLGHSIALLVDV